MNLFLDIAWLIPLLPLLAFAAITALPIRANGRASGILATLAIGAAAVIAIGAAAGTTGGAVAERAIRWAPAGDGALLMGYRIDPMAAAMLVMVTLVSTCIHLFSIGYMAHDARQGRFFSYTALFTAAMLAMVMAGNLLLLFIAWEIMGLCSYLLIGFWYDRNYPQPERITPRQAAIKAFITTRIGDVLLLIGLAYLWVEAGTLAIGAAPGQIFDPALLEQLATAPTALGVSAATAIALLIFAGTIGKSAQFPLHVWLPDAMEGPTPVSALIHAATMVAAGVFLVARTFPIFEVSDALPFVAAIGALTALGGALIACTQYDIKRILAYSTISQLGFMVAALGVGGWGAALFHLLTHACFKALLFLGAGSVIHAMEEAIGHDGDAQDIRAMGGLRNAMPATFAAYAVGALALAGIAPFSGFWSKDEIMAEAFAHGDLLVGVALLAASLLTAFYMTRQVWLVFFGKFRGGAQLPHESPRSMTGALIALAVPSALLGFVNTPWAHLLSDYLGAEAGAFSLPVAAGATLLALAGIGAGYRLYQGAYATAGAADPLARLAPRAFAMLHEAFYLDRLYARVLGGLTGGISAVREWLDTQVIGRLVGGAGALSGILGRLAFLADDAVLNDGADMVARSAQDAGEEIRRSATGRVQDYLALVVAGAVVLGVVAVYAIRP
jgi:NADH-quinone oxidoreductase subunit L